jgi:hypothetical protein
LLSPAGTLPRAASEKLNVDERLGACIPVKPFSPEALAFPVGGKSKPMPVIVEVDPGDVIADVLVMVKVNVLVCELNSQTTVAVESCPELTPTMVIVSARTLEVAAAKTTSAATEKTKRLNRGMRIPPWSSYLRKYNVLSSADVRSGGRTCGASAIPLEALCGQNNRSMPPKDQ